MAKYCGVISFGATAGGGHVAAGSHDPVTGEYHGGPAIPVAVELVSFRIGDKFFRKLRMCQQFVAQFVHPGDKACIYVFKSKGITDVMIGIKSSQHPSYAISFPRFLGMVFAQYVFGALIWLLPALILFGWISSFLVFLGTVAVPSYASWTLLQAYKEMRADFSGQP